VKEGDDDKLDVNVSDALVDADKVAEYDGVAEYEFVTLGDTDPVMDLVGVGVCDTVFELENVAVTVLELLNVGVTDVEILMVGSKV
jgi:hypothetical protein